MFITKDVNSATIGFFKNAVLRKLLMGFSFETESNNRTITHLFRSVNHYGFDLSYETRQDLTEILWRFKNELSKEELTALYFWGLYQKYMCYLENFLAERDTYLEEKFDMEFGRSLAYIYEPMASGLEEDTLDELKLLLFNFASEFDLSLVDKYTCEDILEEMDVYCSAVN